MAPALLAAFFSSASVLVFPLMVTYSRLEAVARRPRRASGGQVAHVADGRLHVVAAAQVLADGLGLGGRLDDDQRGRRPRRPRARRLAASSAPVLARASAPPSVGLAAAWRALRSWRGLAWPASWFLGVAMRSTVLPAEVIAGSTRGATRKRLRSDWQGEIAKSLRATAYDHPACVFPRQLHRSPRPPAAAISTSAFTSRPPGDRTAPAP